MQPIRIIERIPNSLPQYGTVGSAGLDLKCMGAKGLDKFTEIEIEPGETYKIDSGINVWIKDPNFFGMLVPRSSTGTKMDCRLSNSVGIIDSDYQGPLLIMLKNTGKRTVYIEKGQAIAQLLILPVERILFKVVDEFEEETVRGVGGFGSTGK